MATLTATKQAIESRFATQWGTTTPIKYENVSLTEPTVNYVELYVRHSIEKHKGFDGHTHLFRRPGVISIHIRTKMNLGVRPALLLAESAATVFRAKEFSGVRCKEATVHEMGEDNGWYLVIVSINFFTDNAY